MVRRVRRVTESPCSWRGRPGRGRCCWRARSDTSGLSAAGHLYAEATVPAAPVALVLGAQVYPDGTPSPFLAGRLDVAQRLYEAGKVRVILVSGDNMAKEYNEPDAMRDLPDQRRRAGRAGGRRLRRASTPTTPAPGHKRIFGVAELIVVTQSYHLPRAVATCRALGVDATGVGDDSARQHRAVARGCDPRPAGLRQDGDRSGLTRRDPVLGPRRPAWTRRWLADGPVPPGGQACRHPHSVRPQHPVRRLLCCTCRHVSV